MADISILGISGSLRRESHNTGLLRAAAEEMPEGVALRLYDGLRDVPPYDEDELERLRGLGIDTPEDDPTVLVESSESTIRLWFQRVPEPKRSSTSWRA